MIVKRKIVLWATILTFLFVILPAILLQAVMHSRMQSRRDQITDALQSAQSVRLEESDLEGKILSHHELNDRQRTSAVESIRGSLDGGMPFTLALCFVPRHRMIARGASGSEFTFTICFECDEASITGTGPFTLPYRWSSSLRKLFEENGYRLERPGG